MRKPSFAELLRQDIPASLVVFLVAVPLSLGIALASGAPIVAGLIGAVVGGIVTGLLAGSPLQVSGPAAGLTVVVFSQVQQFGWPVVCLITAVAGLVQIGLGFAKIARGTLAISPAVVHGMLAGIGVTIAMAQLHVILGGKPRSSPLQNLAALPEQLARTELSALAVGATALVILAVWKVLPRSMARLRSVPAPLVAVVLSTLVAMVFRLPAERVDLPETLRWSAPALPSDWGAFTVAVLTIAVIASVESLLSAVAVDRLHSGVRSHLDRELLAQGAGNLVSGVLGGLPVTGVIVRSSANVQSGAATRWSAVLHGVWILLFSLLLSSWIEAVPKAALAGLLVFVGVNLVNPHHIAELRTHREAPIYFATLAGVVGLNLLAGVAIGIGLAILMTLRRLAKTRVTVEARADRWHVRCEGTLTFASVPNLSGQLARIPAGTSVDIDLAVDFLDHAAFEAIHGWRRNHEKTGGTVDIDETHEEWYSAAERGAPRPERSLPLSS